MGFAHKRVVAMFVAFQAAIICSSGCGESGTKKNIPLNTVYGIVAPGEMKKARGIAPKEIDNELLTTKNRTINIFIVKGKDIKEAIANTHKVLFRGEFGDGITASDSGTVDAWAVVYLGIGSSDPPAAALESVDLIGSKLVVSYKRPDPGFTTLDNNSFYFWIPLGEVPIGKLDLQVNNSSTMETELLRRVGIYKKQ